MESEPAHEPEVPLSRPESLEGTATSRLKREFESLVDRIRAVERDLSNRDFLTRAPKEIVARQRARRDALAQALKNVRREMERREEDRE